MHAYRDVHAPHPHAYAAMHAYVHVHVHVANVDAVCDRTVSVLLNFPSPNYQDAASQCPDCKQRNLVRCKKCKYCNADIKKKQGHPVRTTKHARYQVGARGGVLVR